MDPLKNIIGLLFLGILPLILSIVLLKLGIKMFMESKTTLKKVVWFGSTQEWIDTKKFIGSIGAIIISLFAIPTFLIITILLIKTLLLN